MMHEEDYLRTRLGRKNPFTTPKGYFDQLATRVMSQLPAIGQESDIKQKPATEQKPAMLRTLRPWLYAAACVAVLVVCVTWLFSQRSPSQQPVATTTNTSVTAVTDSYVDEVADYAMMDNQDIYLYLADL